MRKGVAVKIKTRYVWLLWLLAALPVRADDYPDVRAAQQSVYRVWLGLPLPKEFALQSGTSYRPALDNKGFAVAPFDGTCTCKANLRASCAKRAEAGWCSNTGRSLICC
uniref:Uncharacterized protein n=1 Tax=Conchiformibius kuhniae TaxID=211502 RepID=A0A8T9MUY2_9NEIS|nr:hypothetical protein LVJ77_02005 [Conchiformibius kuhniae]